MLTKLNALREEREDGFTLIELLVVILIIGILAAIAIPVFLNQRKTANDSATQSDVKNATSAIETWIVSQGGVETTVPTASALDIKTSEGVTLVITGTSNGYCVTGTHENGKVASTTGYVYASNSGGISTSGSACEAGYLTSASVEVPTEGGSETPTAGGTYGVEGDSVAGSAYYLSANDDGSMTTNFTLAVDNANKLTLEGGRVDIIDGSGNAQPSAGTLVLDIHGQINTGSITVNDDGSFTYEGSAEGLTGSSGGTSNGDYSMMGITGTYTNNSTGAVTTFYYYDM